MSVNAMTVPAGEALEVLRAGWEAQKAGHITASYMLHGRPGVGKTQVVEQLAREIGARLFDLRLTTIEPQDLRGLPYYDHETRKTRWYRPEDLPDDPDEPSILFLDELTAASPMLQPTVYGLLQERRVGRHVLPRTVFIVAAGNTVEDGAIAYQMNTALSDRLIHLHVQAAAADWLDNYAVPKGLDASVVAFIKTRPDLLDTTERAVAEGHLIATTPRSWERVSRIMGAVAERRVRNVLIAGTVGEAVAAEFALIADDIAATVQVQEMLEADRKARIALYPASMHGLNALIYGLIGVLDARNVQEVIDCMAEIRNLARHRPEEAFARMPLGELCTYGFEGLIRKGLEIGLGEHFLGNEAYRAYAAERKAAGL
ncbi:AAA family ATPase [Rhodovulum sulfidophilum]|uniref:AAA family ATPase n=1 Tax=Rhodovulum sulfidophilum TaxID=35806 RepID=UPI0009515232|nr:MoxR family ATPase [Rhodovulum sulfidophilum]MBL3554144.1 AAA family ATPase [Rhodovulum sulfidophilum]MBL3565443.1 AAA family ATPase [Rhodovulum sulfidophilum]NDK34671.1 AAA domain-containing protein [Rhodovulum sulfidophilum]OLS47244.1 ATPase [Rhodovulum sulfidophilum]OLS53502.1 ATPase [Rhodovulum sulfidophilum]